MEHKKKGGLTAEIKGIFKVGSRSGTDYHHFDSHSCVADMEGKRAAGECLSK